MEVTERASGEAGGDSYSTLVYETTVQLLEANPSRLRTVRRGRKTCRRGSSLVSFLKQYHSSYNKSPLVLTQL
jgi:hypothetical protein